jgi:DNA mismatch repair protein MutS
MDEIGRGTSTYDGVSIAWSIAEFLHNHPNCKPKTLFATHYHELNELAKDFPRIKNFNVSVKEVGNKVVFLRKLKEGGSEHSFGIHVASMAGMPQQIVLRANEIMNVLETDPLKAKSRKAMGNMPKNEFKVAIIDSQAPNLELVREKIEKLDINTISPVEALLKLNEIIAILK